ncbi:glycosyltransferase [Candidatus Woesearchaeota archaeon]|nr:glycosyltransferase [Candidatus Woesearchaeota archaeon]
MTYSQLTVIIPTLNEEKNISRLLKLITSMYSDAKVTVSDDASKDRTQAIVKEAASRNRNISLIDRAKEPEKGLTASVIDAAKKTRTKYLIVIDGDLQHPPEKIKEIYEKLKANDIVGAARRKVLVKWAAHRRIVSSAATLLAKLRLRKNLTDPLSGYFGTRTELFNKVLSENEKKFEKEGYKVFFELLKYAPKNAKITEVKYDFGLRKGGQSKLKARHAVLFIKSLTK